MLNLRSGSVALLTVAVVACSGREAPTSPSGSVVPTAAHLSGGPWTLVSAQPAGEAEQPAPAGAAYHLTFADGRLSTRADCNVCSGPFTLRGTALTAGPALACTRAACPTMAFENVYTRLLGGESTVRLDGNTLVMTSGQGTLRFTR